MSLEVSFEVHVMQKGRWEMMARYPGRKKDAAIQDAIVMGKVSGVEGVRVIRESYNNETGLSDESTVYTSPNLKDPAADKEPVGTGVGESRTASTSKPARASFHRKPASADEPVDMADVGEKKKAAAVTQKPANKGPQSSFLTVIVKLLFVLLFSAIVAGLFSWMSVVWLSGSKFSANAQTNTIFVIFVVTFILSAISMYRTFMSKDTLDLPKLETRAAPPKRPAPKVIKKQAPEKTVFQEDIKTEKVDKEKQEAADSAAEKAEKALTETEPEKETGKGTEEEAEEEEEKEETEEEPLSTKANDQKKLVMTFLNQALKHVMADRQNLDSFNKFGVNLFVAGNCEILSQEHEIDEKSMTAILGECVQVMGFKEADAKVFAGKYADYLLADSRYMQMFQAGRNAMSTYLGEQTGAGEHLEKALAEWNKPKEKEDKLAGPVTVMFTDMVGSTALTQERGDATAQKVVRAHNRIVRDALTEFIGREIKHTGDGIMASFSTTSNGVEAAVSIQRMTAEHNKSNPDLPLHLKIGINAGEPIAEDDDLFGTTVQLSARIVDKAQSEQIFVSEIVRGICAGKEIKFTNLGPYEMKGFAEPVTLYEVIWDEAAA